MAQGRTAAGHGHNGRHHHGRRARTFLPRARLPSRLYRVHPLGYVAQRKHPTAHVAERGGRRAVGERGGVGGRGDGAAEVRQIVEAARANLIATLDGDGQNDPADIPALLTRYREVSTPGDKTFMITGHRTMRKDTWLRRLSSRIANGIRGVMLKDDTLDTGCGLKIFPREAFMAMPRFNHMHRFLPALMLRGGGRIECVHVNHRPRERGASKYGVWNRLWVGIIDLFGVMWLARRPIRADADTLEPTSR